MKSILVLLICLSFLLLGCNQSQFETFDSISDGLSSHSSLSSSYSTSGISISMNAVKVNECNNSQARLEVEVKGAGPAMTGCQAYSLSTQDNRNGEIYVCDRDSKFVDVANYGWNYDAFSDTWRSTQFLRNVAIPGNYTLSFKSSNGSQIKSVSYQLRNPYGLANVCGDSATIQLPQNPGTLQYPVTIVSGMNSGYFGTYKSYEDFAAKVISLGHSKACVKVDLITAYGPNNFPPCIHLYSSNPNPTPQTCTGSQPQDEIRTLACPVGQNGSITERRSYSCVGTTWTASNWSVAANTCSSPPPPPGTCPAYGGPSLSFGSAGQHLNLTADSGSILAIALPSVALSSRKNSGFLTAVSSPSVATPPHGTLEFSISKCPGVIDTNPNNKCYQKFTSLSYTSAIWFARTIPTDPRFATPEAIASRDGCYAPEAEGQWYLNVRWTYSSCSFGAASCGSNFQWNQGSY